LTGVAVKVTEVPWHMLFWLATITTLTGNRGFTVIVTVFEVAGLPVMHDKPEIITTYT
jgi:hypothetical protein